MKTKQNFGFEISVIVLAFLTLISGMQCEKEFPPGTPEIDKLPPATQTGAETFGCLIDGKAFVAQKYWYSEQPCLTAHYQFVDGVWHFSIGAGNTKISPLPTMHLYSQGIEILPKQYELSLHDTPGYFSAMHSIIDNGIIDSYKTNEIYKGEIEISYLDMGTQIMSGTFWFDAINEDGKIIQVREGRFDVHFAK